MQKRAASPNLNITFICLLIFVKFTTTEAVSQQTQFSNDPIPVNQWPATDGLNRKLPQADSLLAPRKNRYVGIFYFLWHNHKLPKNSFGDGPHDIKKILAADPDVMKKPNSPLWGPMGSPHYWGEPLYGYYRSDDPWVLRRHANALTDAGIDVLIFDTTNAVTYPDVYQKLCEVFTQIRNEGGTTPHIAFMVNTKAAETANRIYQDLYQPGRFKEIWFQWHGKPLMICDPALASPELQKFFTLRKAHWPFTMVNTEKAWHWEAAYPQPFGYINDERVPEQVNVSVAQNLRRNDGKVTNMSSGNARGRSFHKGIVSKENGAIDKGLNFQEQWRRAFELDPPFVMVTGWNEWIAGRFERPGEPIAFVDQFDQEHSRDIEFAKGSHVDHYYYQMIANIRRYKGVSPIPDIKTSKTIGLRSDFTQWESVKPEFNDHLGETTPRDHAGMAGLHYANNTGRNDFVQCKVTADDRSIYFYVQCASEIKHDDVKDMCLLIDLDQDKSTGWEGYDLVTGRSLTKDGRMNLEQTNSNADWKTVDQISFKRSGKELHLAIPISHFNQNADKSLAFDFKWTDNVKLPCNIQTFHTDGDVAPNGRLNYRAIIHRN